MLLSAVIQLRARETAVLPSHLGKAAHALFLRLVASADAEAGERLHDDSGPRPFTVSDLMGLPRRGRNAFAAPGASCMLRFTSYDDALSGLLLEQVLPHFPADVELDNSPFSVEGVFLEAGAHPLSGQTSYEELAEQCLLDAKRAPSRVRLFFASPTTFRSQGRNVPLPLPGLVFGSLAERWNAFSSIAISPEVREYAEECLAVAQCHVRTRTVEVAGGKQVGFVGSCTYAALRHEPYWLRVTRLLAAFAFYSGVGYKTTMGLGQTYPRPSPRSRPVTRTPRPPVIPTTVPAGTATRRHPTSNASATSTAGSRPAIRQPLSRAPQATWPRG